MLLSAALAATGFAPLQRQISLPPTPLSPRRPVVTSHSSLRSPPPPACCICINCKWVDRCSTYHWVETQHEQPHVTSKPTFEPDDPQIQVFIRNEGEAEAPVRDAPDAGAEGSGPEGIRTQTLTTEFDVFGCDAFVEERGKWLRLMPNADFIPT